MTHNVLLNAAQKLPTRPGDVARLGRVYGAALPLLIAELGARADTPMVVLAPTVAQAESLRDQIRFFDASGRRIELFPDLEILPYDSFSPHQDLTAGRLQILRELDSGAALTVLAAVPTLLPRLPPADFLQSRAIAIRAEQNLGPDVFRVQLENAGYHRVSQVVNHGEYAVRGSIVDFFPTGRAHPVRVDFLDEMVESLREFDTDTQLTIGMTDQVDTLPAREIPSDAEAIKEFRRRYRRRFEGNPAQSPVYRDVSDGLLPAGVENYLPLFFAHTATLWDYVAPDTLIVCADADDSHFASAWAQVTERFAHAQQDQERPPLQPDELYAPPAEHHEQLDQRPVIWLAGRAIPPEEFDPPARNLPVAPSPRLLISRHDEHPTKALEEFIANWEGRVLLTADSPGRREWLTSLLRDNSLNAATADSWPAFLAQPAGQQLGLAPVDRGALLTDAKIALLAEADLFGESPTRRRRQRRVQDPEALINDLTDLRSGAPVVHAEHGIGRFVGLTSMVIDETRTEFLTLEYDGGDLLHVPVSSLHLVSRYTGASPDHAPLHRLGSDQWARARRKAAEKIRDVAAELLELYAKRAARRGQSCRAEAHDYAAFAADFPFVPTDDQARAIEEVIGDLSSSQPMDRLVCGDVGFGKTEVALRAAFVAATSGRQAAILVPTTLLAQQHHETFADRFAEWPINVEVLSRFRNAADSRRILDGLAAGTIDVVIGTHRLLQPGVRFKNLGLVVIDEEHRFGVRHKERLKALRAHVDVLTLTATPIPRTLNMALGGLRELSLITTPPEARLSIKTFVTRWNGNVIREACLRELKRGGQVYFVHNRIEDIEKIAKQVAKLVPEGRIEVAHGQMRERELERIMHDFYHRKFHVLVCTAIIESGLDVPSANTILINRADRFGLAQLHQLRGRVGRSHHQAFAYLLAPPPDAMTADARKRLEAIESLEDLGAGFVLATHDLEIRGAGELLGEEQSGQIPEIGFSLYSELLSRTIQALRDGLEPDLFGETGKALEVELHLPALLPDDYLPDVHLRLVNYKRIANAATETELDNLQIEMIDRFGLLPRATKNLFRLTALRLRALPLGIRRLDLGPTGGVVEFDKQPNIEPARLIELLESAPETYRLDREQRLRMRSALDDPESRFRFAEQLISGLGGPMIEAADHSLATGGLGA